MAVLCTVVSALLRRAHGGSDHTQLLQLEPGPDACAEPTPCSAAWRPESRTSSEPSGAEVCLWLTESRCPGRLIHGSPAEVEANTNPSEAPRLTSP